MRRIGLVVHPTRKIDVPLATLEEWAAEHGIDVVQLPVGNSPREVAAFGEVDSCDLVVAIGGDGTVLTALRAAAATSTPVLGVACGSLGALSAVTADQLAEALRVFDAGSWWQRRLPALDVTVDGQPAAWALNDFVLVRRTGQLIVEASVGGELYARMAGDGIVVATPIGSSAYSLAAGGPLLVADADAFVATPLLVHGGSVPPVVVPGDVELILQAHPGYAGFDVEVDGHPEPIDGTRFAVRLTASKATLVELGDHGLGLTALRRRGLIMDSPRVLARDDRAQADV
jgi:NAD+ kinase